MKQRTDQLVATDEKLQQFLMWVNEKYLAVNVPYKPAAVRAFYVATVFARNLGLPYDLDRNGDIGFIFNLDVYRNRDFDIALDFNLSRILARACDFNIAFATNDYGVMEEVDEYLYKYFDRVFALDLPLELKQALEQLQKQRYRRGYNIFSQRWWQPNKSWIKQLRYLMIQHRNLGHDWQFSLQQREVFKEYYEANKLLLDCLNSASNVTPAVREEIEETLLLPIAEIEKRFT